MSESAHHRIDYVEFYVASIAAAKAFYGKAFGWTFQDYGPDYCEFRDGRLTGGFAHGEPRPGGALIVIQSDDLESSQAAGEREDGLADAPAGGRRFHFLDRDGYELAVWSQG